MKVKDYQAILDFIWLRVIKNLLKSLEKNEDVLVSYGFTNFAYTSKEKKLEFIQKKFL